MFFIRHQPPSTTLFQENYRCFPMSALKKGADAVHALNYGGKVVMPPSVLEWMMGSAEEQQFLPGRTSDLSSQPLIFSITSLTSNKQTHAGVIEFIAEEGRIYLPEWMLDTLGAKQGEILRVNNASLVKGKFIKLQPQSLDFLDITDPRAVLENTLRHFSALTCGDVIAIDYNDTIFKVLVLETKPSETAVSVFETDIEVDFAPPPGYREPQRTEKSISASLLSETPSTSSLPQDRTTVVPLVLPPSKLFFGHDRVSRRPEAASPSPSTGHSLRSST